MQLKEQEMQHEDGLGGSYIKKRKNERNLRGIFSGIIVQCAMVKPYIYHISLLVLLGWKKIWALIPYAILPLGIQVGNLIFY
jgi:hypothetical protein